MKRGICLLVSIFVLCATSLFSAAAESYPERAITAYIPLPAGDTADIFVRTITPYMEKFLGQPIVLVNKPGAGGSTAVSSLAGAKPDGYTMSWANLPTLVTLPQMRKLVYDAKKLVYIAAPMEFEYILYVAKDSPINSLKELIATAKSKPDNIIYAVLGLGSTNHLGVAWLADKEGIQMKAVPFEGNPKAISAVLGGHATAVNTSTTASVSPYKAGLIKPLVVMSSERIAFIPDTPTLRELGYDFSQYSCLGAVFPEGTPEAVRKRMEDAVRYAVEQNDVKQQAAEKLYARIVFRTGGEYKALCDKYWDIWGRVLEKVKLKTQ
ncbi:MAG: tripartite tricarboxylate transporter substrate binding protein [Desulfovibrio sp.]|nr:tripartite tricarboxylate transporter substrate binding protein [Desulfovibrio sp.]